MILKMFAKQVKQGTKMMVMMRIMMMIMVMIMMVMMLNMMMMMKNDEKSNIFSRIGLILFEKWPPILGKRGVFRGFPPLQKRGIFKIFSTARVCSRARLAQALGKH